jgi:hypothetical protein
MADNCFLEELEGGFVIFLALANQAQVVIRPGIVRVKLNGALVGGYCFGLAVERIVDAAQTIPGQRIQGI